LSRIEAQKEEQVRFEFAQVVRAMQRRGIEPTRVLDIGACMGFYAFQIARRYGCQVTAVEADRGHEATLGLMRRIARQAGTLFFQTAHANGSAFRTVPYLRRFSDIPRYLRQAGFASVEFIAENSHRGVPRYLVLARA
jgi:predicted methyltransferase